jgi:hypothetical protein
MYSIAKRYILAIITMFTAMANSYQNVTLIVREMINLLCHHNIEKDPSIYTIKSKVTGLAFYTRYLDIAIA